MSFDLYEQESMEALGNLPPVQDVEPGFFTGFSQVPKLAMRSLATAGRAASMAAASVPVLLDRINGGTELEDKYFKFHEDTFQNAVDYWTPRPNEVGTAAQVVGELVTTLPMAIAAPPMALASAYLGPAEDLTRQGIDTTKAQAVGAVQSAGFALGIWMPILGKNLWQRTLVGGAGFNALQGTVTRGASGEILEDTPAEGQFKAFDGEALTLDVLMGLGFGSFAHLSPAQRAQGEEAWNKIGEWAQRMTPSQKAAVATLREAQHMNVDSTPGKPIDPSDIEAHVNRMRTAIDHLVNDKPVEVSDMPEPKMKPDPERETQAMEQAKSMQEAAEQVRQDEGITPPPEIAKTITERLMDIGVPPQEAADKGLLWDAFFKSMESRTGQDASQLFSKYYDRVFNAGEALPEDAIMQSAHLETPEFKGWFGDSKVVDAEGKPLVVYHGAPDLRFLKKDGTFKSQKEKLGLGRSEAEHWFTPSLATAKSYADPRRAFDYQNAEEGTVATYLKMENPLIIDGGGQNWRDAQKRGKTIGVIDEARKAGHDGVIIRNVKDDYNNSKTTRVTDTYVVFDSKQIKSATGNRGTYDPNDPNILKQEGARGFLEFNNGKMGIGLLAYADRSTFLHESGHFFLEVMHDLSKDAPDLQGMMGDVFKWMGVTPEQWAGMSLEQKRPYHEQWARGFEQYLMEGKAPTSALKEAFTRFRDWLIEIYKSAEALNVTLSDDVRKVMDKMLTVKESEPRQVPASEGVPPPRVKVGEVPAGNSDLDQALASGEPQLATQRPLDDPDLQAMIRDMAENEAGWAERGGFLLRSGSEVAGEETISRTKWIPRAEWWPDRPAQGKKRLNEAEVSEAIRKHIAGEPLKPLEQRTVEYMGMIANDRLNSLNMLGEEEFAHTMDDLAAENIEPTTEKVFDSQAVARALAQNPEATKMAMENYDLHDDDALFMGEIRSILDEARQQSLETTESGAKDTGADPIQSEAERIAAEDPERRIPIGTDQDGNPVTVSVREYLDEARAQADQARQDVNLIKAAAECLLGQL